MSEQPAPGWYTDPTNRYEHRYWDGATWTEHVSRNGQATTDPLDGSAVAGGATQTGGAATWQAGSAGTWQAGSAGTWQGTAAATTRTNAKAVLSLVLSILWIAGLASVVAIVLGVMARREIRERPDEGGAGMATAGIVIGAVGVAGALLMLFAVISFFAFGEGMYMAP